MCLFLYGDRSRTQRSPLVVFDTYFLRLPFDTTSRSQRRTTGLRLASHSGNLTPPRISPSCPHCLSLWLGRGIIVGGRGRGAACQSRCGSDGYTLASLKAVFLCRSLHRKVLAHPPAAVPVKGPSAKVIQLPDMKLSKNTGGIFPPLLSIPKNSQVTKRFLKFFSIYLGFCFSVLDDTGIIAPLHPTTDKLSVNHNPPP